MPPEPAALQIIDYQDLRLDLKNPRHHAQSSQSDALAALVRDDPSKLVALAKDISSNGLDPTNALLVLRQGDYYTVLEGNRRLAALHLLRGRGVEHLEPNARRALNGSADLEDNVRVRCVIVQSREDARHWIELRHTGQNEGAGVVPWSAAQSARFRPGNTQAHKGLAFLELVRLEFPNDDEIVLACEQVEREKITNLGRLAGDPDVRERLGIKLGVDNEYELEETVDTAAARARVLVMSLADDTSVAELINKDRRLEYVERVLASLVSEESPAARDDADVDNRARATSDSVTSRTSSETNRQSASGEAQADRRSGQAPSGPRSPRRVFQGLSLAALDERIDQVNQEVQSLPLERYPNAVAILIRCLLDMAVESFLADMDSPHTGSFAERVLHAAAILDPNDNPRQQDARLRSIRAWMNADEHLLSAATLHQFVHNPQWHPVPQDLIAIASNLQPFLAWLNQELAQ